MAAARTRTGFGTTSIERMLPDELQARGLVFEPGGLPCTIDLPASHRLRSRCRGCGRRGWAGRPGYARRSFPKRCRVSRTTTVSACSTAPDMDEDATEGPRGDRCSVRAGGPRQAPLADRITSRRCSTKHSEPGDRLDREPAVRIGEGRASAPFPRPVGEHGRWSPGEAAGADRHACGDDDRRNRDREQVDPRGWPRSTPAEKAKAANGMVSAASRPPAGVRERRYRALHPTSTAAIASP